MFILNKNIVGRQIHDTFFLLDITANYMEDRCELYEVNEIGFFIWNNISGKSSVTEITDLLISSIVDEVDYNEVYEDVRKYVEILLDNRFLMEE